MQIYSISVDKGQRETTPSERAFPLGVYHSVMRKNVLGYTPLHWNEELQFCRISHGTIRFYVGEENYTLQEGDGIFINSGYLHMARPVDDPDSSYICLDVMPQLLAGFPGSAMEQKYVLPALSDLGLSHLPLYQTEPWQKTVLEKILHIYESYEARPYGWELEILALLLDIFLAVLEHRPQGTPLMRKSRGNTAVQKIISYISANYGDPITLDQIASYAAYTPSECCRMFKRFTGESIFSYLREFRLEQSANLLTSTEQSVSDIAYTCGFNSTSYYIDTFKKQFGITPLQYKKQHNEA